MSQSVARLKNELKSDNELVVFVKLVVVTTIIN